MAKAELGSVIARKRQDKGMSQRELAVAIKVSNSTIARIERGEFTMPSSEILRDISRTLDIDYNYLLALNKQIDDEPEIRAIQRAAKRMSQSEKTKMVNVLRQFFDEAFENAGSDEDSVG